MAPRDQPGSSAALPLRAGSADDPDELFDRVDAHDRIIGRVRRRDAHRDPRLWHRSVEVLVFASDGRVLIQRRGASKDLYPGYSCASASGHVASGETYDDTARRETAEELGITPSLAFVRTFAVPTPLESEITALYLARCDGPFHFHPAETQGGAFFDRTALRAGQTAGTLWLTPSLVAALDVVDRLEAEGRLTPLLDRL